MTNLARVTEILRSGSWSPHTAVDSLCLSYDERHRRRLRYVAAKGTPFLLDLVKATVLRAGDGLKLDDGRIVLVQAAPESLVAVTAPDRQTLLRLTWHIGNRHLPAQLEPDRIVIREDSVIVGMLVGLGASVQPFEGAFSPEAGAYDDASKPGGTHAHEGGKGAHGHTHGGSEGTHGHAPTHGFGVFVDAHVHAAPVGHSHDD